MVLFDNNENDYHYIPPGRKARAMARRAVKKWRAAQQGGRQAPDFAEKGAPGDTLRID